MAWLAMLLAACGGGGAGGDPALLKTAGTPEPQSGIWWNPSASGSGYAVERQGTIVTLGAYLYEADGKPVWYVGPLARQTNGSYNGVLTRYAGGQTLTGSYKAPTSSAAVATATFTLTTDTAGSLLIQTSSGQSTVPVQRFSLSGGATPAPSSVGLENGLWWNDTESGRGFFLDIQGATAALSSYMYDATGQPVWYLTVGTVSNLTFTGALQSYRDGQALGGAYRAPTPSGSAGNVTFRGITGTTAELTLPDGRVIPLKRLVFAPGGSGGGSTGPKLDGAYEGTVVSGTETVRISMLALETDEVWLVYGFGATSLSQMEGMRVTTGTSANGNYTSTGVLDVPGDEPAHGGSMSGTYVNRSSFNAQVTSTGSPGPSALTSTAIPVARYNYDTAASLATVAGTWALASTGTETGSMTVAANGTVSGSLGGCTVSGMLVPRPSGKNVFNLSVAFSGTGDCNFSAAGVAWNTAGATGSSQLWMTFVNTARTDGGVLRGQR